MPDRLNGMHIWYSAQAKAAGCGSSYYNLQGGGQVEGTCVTEERAGDSYKWPDKQYRGVCLSWASSCTASRFNEERIGMRLASSEYWRRPFINRPTRINLHALSPYGQNTRDRRKMRRELKKLYA